MKFFSRSSWPIMIDDSFLQHVQFAYINYISIITFCTVGIFVNATMLVYLVKKKQVCASVYSIYIIQIVAIDILLCIVWLAYLTPMLNELPSNIEVQQIMETTENSFLLSQVEEPSEENSDFEKYRILYAIRNMHNFINIFLLAAMSIERSLAVRKSLQCQRYQFKKNIIFAASVGMWLAAIACVVPSYINRDWITDNVQKDLLVGKMNENNNKIAETPLKMVFDCSKPLLHARQNNLDQVRDYDHISAEQCFDYMQNYVFAHLDVIPELKADDSKNERRKREKSFHARRQRETGNVEPPSGNHASGKKLTYESYDIWLRLFAKVVQNMSLEKNGFQDLCDPLLSRNTMIYQIVTNVVVGFFVPFSIIVVTNLYIAYHIWMPAQRRLKNRRAALIRATRTPTSCDHSAQNQYSRTGPRVCNGSGFEASTDRDQTKRNNEVKVHENIELQNLNGSETELRDEATLQKSHLTPYPFVRDEDCKWQRERTPSFLRMLQKRFRVSTYSAESFPTDLTTLVTSCSPGIGQSKHAFLYGDETESQPLTGSSESSKRASIRSHSAIPDINVVTDELRNSLLEISREVSETNKSGRLENLSDGNSNTKPAATTPPNEIVAESDKGYGTASPSSGSQEINSSAAPSISEYKSNSMPSSETEKFQETSLSSKLRSCQSAPEPHSISAQPHEASTLGGTRRSRSHSTLYKNAERQIQLSRIILFYVVTYVASWLPSKIVTTIYYTNGFIGETGHYCHHILGITRILNFVSVLLNPIVYATTQKSVNRYMRQLLFRLRKGFCSCVEILASKFVHPTRSKDDANDEQISSVKIDDGQNGKARLERHEKNRQRWTKIAERLGKNNPRFSYSTAHQNTSKISDGTIDEEKEGQRSNLQSTST